jgi:membrane protease YdiL (CAAX protease family)
MTSPHSLTCSAAATGPARPGLLRRLAARRPLTVFLTLGLGLGYALAFVWGLAYHGLIPGGGLAAALNIAPDELAGGLTVLALFPAALSVTWAVDGRDGVRTLFRRVFRWRVHPGWWLIVLLGLPTITVGLAVLAGDQLRPVDAATLIADQLALLAVNVLVINLWEETAWTGLVQTRLESRHPWFIAAVLTAIPFAAAHLPLPFFLDQPVTLGSVGASFAVYLVLGLLVRPMFAVYRRATGDSLLLVGLLHGVFNRTANQNGIAASLLVGDTSKLTMLIAVIALTTVTAIAVARPRAVRRRWRSSDPPPGGRDELPR